MTTKTCIACASNFTNESPSDDGLGVCPKCNKRLEIAMKQNLEMFEVPHGNPEMSVWQGSNKNNGQVV